ncbi:MAG: hypothetical protein CMP06_08370 [Xanthomonadales bacterium]|nr:hypothetical protein [Xanthomonadales bacterium]
MPRFVMNKNAQSNGDHEVHNTTSGCRYMPQPFNQIDLGVHLTCHGAVAQAKRQYPSWRINGCYYCCNVCHTS